MSSLKYKIHYKYINPNKEAEPSFYKRLFKKIVINSFPFIRKKISKDYNDFKILTNIFQLNFISKIKQLLSEASEVLGEYHWDIGIRFIRITDDGYYNIEIIAMSKTDLQVNYKLIIVENFKNFKQTRPFDKIKINDIPQVLENIKIEHMYLFYENIVSLLTFNKPEPFEGHSQKLNDFIKRTKNKNLCPFDENEGFLCKPKYIVKNNLYWSLYFANIGHNFKIFRNSKNIFQEIKYDSDKDFLRGIIETNIIDIGSNYLEVLENNTVDEVLEYIKVLNY